MTAGKFQIRALGAAMAFFSIGVVEAALTEQQVNGALGSVPGVNWSVEGPNADAWTMAGGPALNVTSAAQGESYLLKGVVTGPGVLELTWDRTSYSFTGSILVDGVTRTPLYTNTKRITVGAGTHTVTWKMDRTFSGSTPGTATFTGAKWETFNNLPLEAEAKDGSVVLSGTWVGQDRWHCGDGGAVFSAIGGATPTPVLRGDFNGPGILTYQVMHRSGLVSFRLNNGQSLPMYENDGAWVRNWQPAGIGNHRATWESYGNEAEAVIDEVQLVPEVDLVAALDLAGRVWVSSLDGNGRAFGVPMEDARGGHAVILGRSVSLSTQFDGGGILKIRYRGGSPDFQFNGSFLRYTSTVTEPGTDWITKIVGVPEGGGTLRIGSNGVVQLDGAEWQSAPATVADVLGLPAQGTSTGGEGAWEIVPSVAARTFVARASLMPAAPTAWVDLNVTGPARVEICYEASHDGVLGFLLDGEELWDSSVPSAAGKVSLEIPAGQHVVRCLARNVYGSQYFPFTAEIRGIKVMEYERAGEISQALGFSGGWAMVGDWEKVVSPEGGGQALRPSVPQGTSGDVTAWLGTTVTGPGYLSFWTNQPADYPSSVLTVHGDTFPILYPETYVTGGPALRRHWFPPGAHKVQLKLAGAAAKMAATQLHGMEFQRAVPLSLDDISTGEPVMWENDTVKPWTVASREQATPVVVASPLRGEGETDGTSRISATMNGPGLLAFTWGKQGRRFLNAELWLNGERTGKNLANWSERTDMIELPPGSNKVEWVAVPNETGTWLEVENVNWQPWPESSLASALDAPTGVTWESGGDTAFTGRPDAGSKDGTAAHVRLEAGQTSWLEATMDGPGVFDFWLRRSATTGYEWQFHVNWIVTVDDVEVLRSPAQSWDPIWVRGEGPHKVRVAFTNPMGGIISGLMDDVTWIPLVQRAMDSSWTSNVPEATNGYEGPDGGGFILRTSYFTPSWIEKTVTGPCEVEWQSLAVGGAELIGGQPTVTVDGKGAVVIRREDGLDRNVLTIPAGEHVIRWANVTEHTNGYGSIQPEEMQGSFWQISDPVVGSEVSPIAQLMDAPGSCWLVQGWSGGMIVGEGAMDGVAAFVAGVDRRFHYLNLSGSAQRLRSGVRYSTDEEWRILRRVVEEGQAMQWAGTYGFAQAMDYALDMFTAEDLTEVALHQAVDVAGDMPHDGWRGIVSPTESEDGVDCAWSFADDPYAYQTASMTVNRASRVRFRWKQTGTSSLVLRLNGAALPVAPPGGAWAEVSFEVGDGEHRIDWTHTGREGTSFFNVGEAWLDAVAIDPLAAWDLTAAAAGESGVILTADAPIDAVLQWKAASFQLPDGGTVTGARGATGASGMRASITGPVVVSFRGACFADKAAETMVARSARGEKSVWENIGGGGGSVAGYELTVMVGDKVAGSIPHRDGIEWSDVEFFVPEGTHEVTWRVNALKTSIIPGFHSREPAQWVDLQGWVSDLRLESRRARFDRWAEILPEGKRGLEDDADGDGVSNMLEYAFRSHAGDESSKPLQVTGQKGPAVIRARDPWTSGPRDGLYYIGAEISSFEVMVPYLSLFVDGKLEVSGDLNTWDEYPVEWLEGRPPANPFVIGFMSHTDTHQAVSVPLYEEDTAKFFRVKVAVPD